MSNLKNRINKAEALAREQEKARHDRKLAGLMEVLDIGSVGDVCAVWLEKARAGHALDEYLPVPLCDMITRTRAKLPEVIRIGFKIWTRNYQSREEITKLEMWAMIAVYIHTYDVLGGNYGTLFYAVDSEAGEDSAALALREALTIEEHEALKTALSLEIETTRKQDQLLYAAVARLLPLVEVAREAMRARGLAYDGNPAKLTTLANLAHDANG